MNAPALRDTASKNGADWPDGSLGAREPPGPVRSGN